MVHYMPWYQTPDVRGSWGTHWTGHQRQHHPDNLGTNGLPDIWSKYHPLIGLYDSSDPDVLECHLLQMKLAGTDGVIVDWYGIGDTADYPPMNLDTPFLRLYRPQGRGKSGTPFRLPQKTFVYLPAYTNCVKQMA